MMWGALATIIEMTIEMMAIFKCKTNFIESLCR